MKQHFHLTPRLAAVAAQVPTGATLCDVGTDHAYLPTYLLLEGRIEHAIASDIRKGPLERAAHTAEQYQLTDRIDLRLCAGLEGTRAGEADTVTICGMGGEMICGILQAAPWTAQDVLLILQPQRSQDDLRLWLAGNGYRILRESVVQEGERWYTVMTVKGGTETITYTPASKLAGHPSHWVDEPSRLPYLLMLQDKLLTLKGRIERSTLEENRPRIAQLNAALEELGGWIDHLSKGASTQCLL